ncbi:MAG: secretin N-terminal domain-containing protein [Burkholderiaceae bacterium]
MISIKPIPIVPIKLWRSRLALSRRLFILVTCIVSACAAGGGLHTEGLDMIAQGNREGGVARLREASNAEPSNAEYKIHLLREQALYARELIQQADEARAAGKAADAMTLYQKALQMQPADEKATRGIALLRMDARHQSLAAEAERLLREGALEPARTAIATVLTENPSNEVAQKIAAAIAEQQAKQDQSKAAQIAAQSILRKPVTLQFRDANLRMVFEALSRTTGLNVILDRDVRADLKTTIFVKDASVEDTVDLILLQNQLEKRTLNASTLFVYPATAAKNKEYQDLQVRVFQIANGDAKYLQTVLKSLLKIKDISVDERANTLVVRDTPDAVAVAAKIIAAHDMPEAEVMLEVEVLEVLHTRLSNIGLQLPTSLEVATPTSATTIGAFRALSRNDLTVTGLSTTLNLQLQDSDANILASPRIRARNKEKAKILIGDRVPTIINSVTPIQTGGSVVTGSVQYQDVGLKLEFEPQIYNAQEVGIKLNLEVSNIAATFTDSQGGRSYQIGTRSAQTSLRLRDGETQVLGGLISDQDRNTAAKVPGLGHLPAFGFLFGNNDMNRTKTEIVLSITPRIIRAPSNVDAALKEIFSGTESSIRERALRLDPVSDFRSTAPRPSAAAPSAAPAAPALAAPSANPSAATSAPSTVRAMPDTSNRTPAVAFAAAPPTATPSAPAGSMDLTWAGPASARVGETFKLTLSATSLPALRDMPVTVRFDPGALRFESANLGDLAERAGASPPAPTVDALKGRLDIPLSFAQPDALVGDGALLELTFQVHTGRAVTQLVVTQNEASSPDGSRLVLPGPRNISLRITR